jgi:transcriptional regulator with XRE-family HTH domain
MENSWIPVSEAIAQKIKHRLNECGILRKDFAKMMGVAPSKVTKWLSGKCNFEIFTLFKIEEKLQLSLIAIQPPQTEQP